MVLLLIKGLIKMRNLVYIWIILICIGGTLSCVTEDTDTATLTPSEIVTEFYDALEKGDAQRAARFMTTRFMGTSARVNRIGKKALAVVIAGEAALAKDSTYRVLKEQTLDDKSIVTIERIFTPKNERSEKNIYLRKLSDSWFIVRIGGESPW